MKLFRFGASGHEKPGAVDADGQLRDLSLLIDDWTPRWLAPERLQALRAIDLRQLPVVPADSRLGVPVHGIGQFLAIGLNYRQHAQEANMPLPTEPVVFNKALTCLAGANDDLALPPDSQTTDWEVELGIVVGRTTHRVEEAQALDHVAGYVLANDVSERDWQIHHNGQWVKGKSYPGFGPIGPWLVTADEVPDPQQIGLTLSVNGQQRQASSTADMIFSVAHIVSYLSQFMVLQPGDVILTGTPEGVGMGQRPPVYLRRGDTVELSGGILGTQTQRIL